MKKLPDTIKEAARSLRQNMTYAEVLLWEQLKDKKFENIKFVRQKPIYVCTDNSGLDRYIIPDFLSKGSKLIIELDGSVHDLKEVYQLDQTKEKILKDNGYTILRLKNSEIINNITSCLNKIAASFSLSGGENSRVGEIL